MTTIVGEASADVIAAFMQQVIVEYHNFASSHRRTEPREAIAVPVVIQPTNDEFEPMGGSIHAITRDISYGGIAIFHSHRIQAPYLRITMTSPATASKMQLLAKIEHQTQCGGFQIIGCRFAPETANANES